jgi:hypothetical protein
MILRACYAECGRATQRAATPAQPDSRMVGERETGREPFDRRTAANDPQDFPTMGDQQRVVSAESRPIPQTAPDRPSECERSHLTCRRCEVCAREFVPKRRWQRGCGSPACRAAASRRRRADRLREGLEQIAEALNLGAVEEANARWAHCSTLPRCRRSLTSGGSLGRWGMDPQRPCFRLTA